MKIIYCFILVMIYGVEIVAQAPKLNVKGVNGWLFFSKKNFQYDWKEGVSEIRELGFHDFFFPVDGLQLKSVLDSNLSITLKNGVRIDYLKNRSELKVKARKIKCKDTSGCYYFDDFYLLPVTIKSVALEDYEPFVCNRSFFELKVLNGSILRFEYQHLVFMTIDTIIVR